MSPKVQPQTTKYQNKKLNSKNQVSGRSLRSSRLWKLQIGTSAWNLVVSCWNFIKTRPWLGELVVFAAFLLAYFPLEKGNVFADPDSFYHLKMAELISARGPIRDFVWLPYTELARAFADQHFLYHVFLIPFVEIMGPLAGIKAATSALMAFAIAALAWSMRKSGVRMAWIWAALAGIMNPLIFRIGLAKASAPGVALLAMGLALSVAGAAWPLAMLAFVHVWTHGSWIALVGLGTAAIIIVNWGKAPEIRVIANPSEARVKQSHVNGAKASIFWRLLRRLRLLAMTVAGMRGTRQLLALWFGTLAGLVVNPFFPNNLRFYWEQIVQIAAVNYQGVIGVGQEWYPYGFANLVRDLPLLSLLAAAAIIAGPAVFAYRSNSDKARSRRVLAICFAALVFLFLTLRSRRHVEYFVPLAVWAVASLASLISAERIKHAFRRFAPSMVLLALGSLAILGSFAEQGFFAARRDLHNGYRYELYMGAAEYLAVHAAENEVVVHADWDDFPPLFLWDDKNRYVMGLDPTFLYRADSKLYRRYVDFTLGESRDPLGVMRELDARYVVADHAHGAMESMLENALRFEKVYEDKDAVIYSLK